MKIKELSCPFKDMKIFPPAQATLLRRKLLGAFALCTFGITALGQISPVGPFRGSLKEGWESFPLGALYSQPNVSSPTSIMHGAAIISNGRFVIYDTSSNVWHLGYLPESGAINAGVANG